MVKATTPFLFFLITSISFSQTVPRKLFESEIESTVVKNVPIELDSLKGLVIYPGGAQLRKDLEKMGYFDQIMDESDFKKEMKKAGLNKSEFNLDTEAGLKNVFYKYKKFVLIYQSVSREDKKMPQYVIFTVQHGEVFVVQNQAYVSRTVGINYDPKYVTPESNNSMLNAIVDYIRTNSKTYN